jgi:hypothetical protein
MRKKSRLIRKKAVEAKKKPFGNRKKPSKLFFCSLLNKKAAKAFFQGKKAVDCNL